MESVEFGGILTFIDTTCTHRYHKLVVAAVLKKKILDNGKGFLFCGFVFQVCSLK